MHPEHRSIGELAYRLWQARGCPQGTAEKDWLDAERQLAQSPGSQLPDEASRLPDETSRAPDESGRFPEQPPAKSSAKRPSRARTLQSKSAASKPVSKPTNDSAG
jgi:LmbE family N-acetylglucosaminyl deacetylase